MFRQSLNGSKRTSVAPDITFIVIQKQKLTEYQRRGTDMSNMSIEKCLLFKKLIQIENKYVICKGAFLSKGVTVLWQHCRRSSLQTLTQKTRFYS